LVFGVELGSVFDCDSVELGIVDISLIQLVAHRVGRECRDCKLGQKGYVAHIDQLVGSKVINAGHECEVDCGIGEEAEASQDPGVGDLSFDYYALFIVGLGPPCPLFPVGPLHELLDDSDAFKFSIFVA
jgi:hypothetical protein